MLVVMRSVKPQIGSVVEDMLDDTISEDQIDCMLAEDHDEINALLKEAYDAKERGDSAPLEPLHVLLAEERTRFSASRA
jgi:hypothetical protein